MTVIPNGVRDRLTFIANTFRRIVGMPNYAAYVAHLRDKHPECAIPSEREYYDMYLDAKYNGGPGSRCC